MPVTKQVTLGTGATQLSPHGINFKQLIVQYNGANTGTRYGDSTVVAGAYGTGKGILLAPSGSVNWGNLPIQAGILSNCYVAGTSGDTIDICYEPA